MYLPSSGKVHPVSLKLYIFPCISQALYFPSLIFHSESTKLCIAPCISQVVYLALYLPSCIFVMLLLYPRGVRQTQQNIIRTVLELEQDLTDNNK